MKETALQYALKAGFTPEETKEMEKDLDEFYAYDLCERFFDDLSDKLFDKEYDLVKFCEELKEYAQKFSLHEYTFYFYFYLCNAKRLNDEYQKNNLPEWVYLDSIHDFWSKNIEKRAPKVGYGIDCPSWFVALFRLQRWGLGRLIYNLYNFPYDTYSKHGVTVKKGDTVIAMHIPGGDKLTKQARLDSYKKAYEFFQEKGVFTDGIMKVTCHTWMLYPEYFPYYGEKSNLYDFTKDFDVFSTEQTPKFDDGWRVFGGEFNHDYDVLPQNTTLQKSFVQYGKTVKKFGKGCGIILFDGEKILK